MDRKDLDRQTREEFNRFQEGCVEENTNTRALVDRLLSDDKSDKVIVTTIQKLGLALGETGKRNRQFEKQGKETFKQRLKPLRDKRLVFIFDECHRSQFGENHRAIKPFFPSPSSSASPARPSSSKTPPAFRSRARIPPCSPPRTFFSASCTNTPSPTPAASTPCSPPPPSTTPSCITRSSRPSRLRTRPPILALPRSKSPAFSPRPLRATPTCSSSRKTCSRKSRTTKKTPSAKKPPFAPSSTPTTPATAPTTPSPDELNAFRSVYLETAQRLKAGQAKPDATPSTAVEAFDFEFVLFASAHIDYDYIMGLLSRFSHETPTRQTMNREQLIGLILADAKFMDERETITAYVRTLQAGQGLNQKEIEAGYRRFRDECHAAELAAIAQKHTLATDRLQAFVDAILRRMVFDGEQLTELLASLGLNWKARRVAKLALMEDLMPLLKKRAAGREISGLNAYEP